MKQTAPAELVTSEVSGILTSQETDVQIATAKKYPRSLKRFVESSTDMATLNESTAGECVYAIKRDSQIIEGASTSFASILASNWGNCRVGSRVISNDDKFVTAQGIFVDLENNVVITSETRRRITYKTGKTYNDDMIGVTGNAACSVASRNAILKAIPKAIWGPIYEAARKKAVGDAKTIASKRSQMISYFEKLGVTQDAVLTFLGAAAVSDITAEELAVMKSLAREIRDNEKTIEEAFELTEPESNIEAEAEKCKTKGDVNVLRDLTLEMHGQDEVACAHINEVCDARLETIHSSRGERSNKQDGFLTDSAGEGIG